MSIPSEVIIIGTGVFGISTAISLAKRYPSTKIHVFDRYEPPVADATSVDTTRVLRTDYNDEIYEKLSYEAMQLIKADPEISQFFHESGMSVIYDGKDDRWAKMYDGDIKSAQRILKNEPEKLVEFNDSTAVFKSIHGSENEPESLTKLGRKTWWNKGYCNKANGFIDAARAIEAYYKRAKTFPNIKFTFNPVEKIIFEDNTNRACGVQLQDGSMFFSKLVIVAAGAWSAKLVDLEGICFSSAIEVAWYKLSKKEEEQWKDMAITTNLSTGINIFPPYNGEIKILRRSAGYKNTIEIPHPDPTKAGSKIKISHPRTILTNKNDYIPEEAEIALRENMKEILPSLYNRPFDRTKLCWLTQTKSANFLIDYHPKLQNVLLATAGSAHGWKFVSIIGDKVVDFMSGKLDSVLKQRWSWNEKLELQDDNGSAPRMTGEAHELRDYVRDGSKLRQKANL
ncbi:hypothetical protein WICANDRAFT_56698 [Wickerhamomyces anomalus NRRL Y-366-8]|uniref:FAD dependent oxidoreductase domain-containing protein n=1 Tax=Wickerhamomyces anomalus (strain ATCC 58044 / CBS 1984 / NCYC 433 / NRRL Y-366-8) TaxID=683960 RepID=A0A1E3NZI2_WICAA|nr:uncharacterized protein WICANDRAFT_56698 [Wickerhamomyces anomalus NRRL Y-366-8]ODQ58092.1 hypothetical protein WICANDRAFT_56698 [Wickerhamomyces anomalus NRRL Y-366-8]